jgi:hypothetical protein
MIYLAAPYSDPDRSIRERRMRNVELALAYYSKLGVNITSPLLMHHCLNTSIKLPSDFKFWQSLCRAYWDVCSEMIVLELPGWSESIGLQTEIRWARDSGKPLTFIHPSFFHLTTNHTKIIQHD